MGNTQRHYCTKDITTHINLSLSISRNILFSVSSSDAQYMFGAIVGQGGTGPALLDPLAFFIK